MTPTFGESIADAVVGRWTRAEGETVRRDDVLVELETDKVVLEVCAPEDGTLVTIACSPGTTVTPGTLLGRVTPGDSMPDPMPQPTPAPAPAPAPPGPRLARHVPDRERRVPMSRLRQSIARRLKDAQNTAAMLTTFNEVDMSAVMAARKRHGAPFETRHQVKLGFMGFFVKACVAALQAVPDVNTEIDGGDLIYKTHYDIGVAVGTDRGLVVPVIRGADTASLADIEARIGALGRKAREGRLELAELSGGTFTISNGGVYGSLLSTPILNAPQSGILGMHAIQERPVAVAGEVVIRPMMYLALSYDHRVVDGKGAVTFLVKVKELIEDPYRLLLEI